MSSPILVLVPGAWSTLKIYEPTLACLPSHIISHPLTLPSVSSPPKSSYSDDVGYLRRRLADLIETEGRNVILVCHSVTGLCSSDAAKDFWIKDREQAGKSNGIVRMVYINALAMPEGFQCYENNAPGTAQPWMRLDPETETYTVSLEDARRVFYNDISDEEAEKWWKLQQPVSGNIFVSKQEYSAWRHIPSTFVMSEDDSTAMNKSLAEYMIAQDAPNKFDHIERWSGGHFPMIAKGDKLAALLADLVEKETR